MSRTIRSAAIEEDGQPSRPRNQYRRPGKGRNNQMRDIITEALLEEDDVFGDMLAELDSMGGSIFVDYSLVQETLSADLDALADEGGFYDDLPGDDA